MQKVLNSFIIREIIAQLNNVNNFEGRDSNNAETVGIQKRNKIFFTDYKPEIFCNCSKIKCDNRYCSCSKAGKYCVNCNCKCCENKLPKGACLSKHPEMNEKDSQRKREGIACKCNKSCTQKYCECLKMV